MNSQESRLPAPILHPLTLLAASANRVGMSPFSISADKGYHSTVCVYSAKIFLSFQKDSHISAAHWGCLQPVITPKLCLGITREMPAGPCQGLCSPSNTVDSLVLLPEPVPRTCIVHQLRCSCSLAALSSKGLSPDWQHERFHSSRAANPAVLQQTCQNLSSAPIAALPPGQRRLQLWQHATSCTYSNGILEEINLQLPKRSPSLPGPTPRASPLSCSPGQLVSHHSSSAAPV